jgi:hypothetical protein
VTPKVIHDNICKWQQNFINTRETLYEWLLNIFLNVRKKKQKTLCESNDYKKMLNIYIESYLYEPGNHSSNGTQQQKENLYICSTYPATLHPYNKGFERMDTQIHVDQVDTCSDIQYCVGAGDGTTHPFLKQEGVIECVGCKCVVCSTCKIDAKIGNDKDVRICCIECYGEEPSFPINKIQLTEHLSLRDV